MLSHLAIVSQKIVLSLNKKYNFDEYNIIQNGGIFNDVGHCHLHIFLDIRMMDLVGGVSDKIYECSNEVAKTINDYIN